MLHLVSNCEGCEFELLEALLQGGFMPRFASLTIHTHKTRAFGEVPRVFFFARKIMRRPHAHACAGRERKVCVCAREKERERERER